MINKNAVPFNITTERDTESLTIKNTEKLITKCNHFDAWVTTENIQLSTITLKTQNVSRLRVLIQRKDFDDY